MHWDHQLKSNDSQVVRRAFVRTALSEIESLVFMMKSDVAEETEDPALKAVALDKQYVVDDNGNVQSRQQSPPLKQSIRFAFNAHASVTGSDFKLETNTDGWQAVLDGIRIRNRITHPKAASELAIGDDELKRVRTAFQWMYEQAWKAQRAARLASAAKLRKAQEEIAAFEKLNATLKGGT